MPVQGGALAGKISKPYGLKGDVYIILDPASGKNIEADIPLFIDIDGQRVPFFVEDFEVISKSQAIVKFEFVNKLEEAREISGCSVYFDYSSSKSSMNLENDFSQLIGFTAKDKQLGELGPVTDYIPGAMNPCFLIDYHGRELIVPAVSELILQISKKEKTIHFNLPEGLTEL